MVPVLVVCMASAAAALAPTAAPPLPTSAAATAAEAARSASYALAAGRRRLQLTVLGDGFASPGPLPLIALAEALADALSDRPLHVVLDDMSAAAAWQAAPAAKRLAAEKGVRHSVLGLGNIQPDEGAVLLAAPSNRRQPRRGSERLDTAEPDVRKLEAVQSLVCGSSARGLPCLIANHDLEAMLLTRRVARPTAPMLISDFEHCYFMAAAPAAPGEVSHVRRRWGDEWEVYKRPGNALTARRAGNVPATPGEPPQLSRVSQAQPKVASLVAARARARARGFES